MYFQDLYKILEGFNFQNHNHAKLQMLWMKVKIIILDYSTYIFPLYIMLNGPWWNKQDYNTLPLRFFHLCSKVPKPRLTISRQKRCEEDRWVQLANIGECGFFLRKFAHFWIKKIQNIHIFTFSESGENFPCPERYGTERRQAIASKKSQDR